MIPPLKPCAAGDIEAPTTKDLDPTRDSFSDTGESTLGSPGGPDPDDPNAKGLSSLRYPNKRHHIEKVTQRSPAKSTNTVIEQGVDISADVNAIRSELAIRTGNTFNISGRTYGLHGKTFYPIKGLGFQILDRGAYKAPGV